MTWHEALPWIEIRLFYAGWIYRYWHFKTGESSREIYRQADENRILMAYGLHTESNDLAVEDLRK